MAHIIDVTMDRNDRRKLMDIIRDEFADWKSEDEVTIYKVIHGYVAEAHIGRPHGMVDNENLHLFRQYRNRVSADPAAMLREAGFSRPAEIDEENAEALRRKGESAHIRKLESELRQLERFAKEVSDGYFEADEDVEYFEGCEDWAYPARLSSIALYRKAIESPTTA